jgi:HlyD family secretion protein
MENIFPEDILCFSAEEHFFQNRIKGKPLYLTIIALLFSSMIILPLIRVDVTYSARGILRTLDESSQIIIPVQGLVSINRIKLNKFVSTGDTLLCIDSRAISQEIRDTQTAISILRNSILDLSSILSNNIEPVSIKYKSLKSEYISEISKLETELAHLKDEFMTNKILYEEGFIARLDYESIRKEYTSAKLLLKVSKNAFQNQCLAEISNNEMEILKLNSRLGQLQKTHEMHVIRAAVSGFITDYTDIPKGSYLNAGSAVARIVQDQDLLAICIIPSDKITRISMGQDVKINIDAFPVSSFGWIKGNVISIPQDATLYSGIPQFQIQCKIEQEFSRANSLQSSGLQSGMTFTGLFILARKSILQLILEKGEKMLIPAATNLSDNANKQI